MTRKVMVLVGISLMLILSQCRSPKFTYLSQKQLNNRIGNPTKINVACIDAKNLKDFGFKNINNDITECVTNDLEQNVFTKLTTSKPEIVCNVRVDLLSNKVSMWGCGWGFLWWAGLPMGSVKGKAMVNLELLNKNGEFIKSYQSTKEKKKVIGLYYGHTAYLGQEDCVTTKALVEAMDELKTRIETDRNLIVNSLPKEKVIVDEQPIVNIPKVEQSEVDINIPSTNKSNENKFALIIGNEDYSSFQTNLGSEVNVQYAANDAKTFKEYAIKTLGIPEENVKLLINAKTVELNREISKLSLYAKNSTGKAELYFFYAGHGLPDENTKESYLIPVDVTGSDLKFAVKIEDLYTKLTEFPTLKTTVFLDACFSGGARNQSLVSARSVKIKPKDEVLKGNLIVFASSTGDQSSLPYKDKFHGMFTYFLLKKLQDTKGDISYKELSEYLNTKVSIKSLQINNKEQNPQTNISPDAKAIWENWNFNR